MDMQTYKLRFDLDDPRQVAAFNMIQSMKKGTRGSLVGEALLRLLAEHGFSGLAKTPVLAVMALEVITKAPLERAPIGYSEPMEAGNNNKKKPRKAKQKPGSVIEETKEASSPVPDENKIKVEPKDIPPQATEAPKKDFVPNPKYPWRLPDGKMRALTEEEAEAMQGDEETMELYIKEIMDYATEHPEDAPSLG